MKLGFATQISLRSIQDLVDGDNRLPVGYEFGPAADWVRLLLKRGHHVTVYTTARDVESAETYHGDCLTIRIAKERSWGAGKDLFGAERRQLTAMMKEDQCELIHAHWTYEFALASLASGIPTLVTVHDLPWNVLRFFKDKFRTAKVLVAYAVALRGKHFTAVSTDAAMHFHRYFVPWREVEVVPNGLPDAVFRLKDKYPAAARDEVAFGTILQGWSARKNASAALKAFAIVRAQHPGVTLRMFGTDYEPGGHAEQWATKSGLSDGVFFVGKVPYEELLPRVSREIDVLVHPSLDESFSMATLEAMALKKPVIAGKNTPGVREVLDFGTAGILLDMTDASALAKAMLQLASDPSCRSQTAAAGYERARSTFRLEVVFAQYERMYERVLHEARHG